MADPAVSDTDFRDILDATRQFIRSAVMPRELEIMAENRVPDDIRDQAKKMGLFGTRFPRSGFGTNDQKTRWLEGIASGEVVASFALTEPGAGSNPAGLRTKAVRDGSRADAAWVITGQKRFIINGPTADLFVVFARSRVADSEGPPVSRSSWFPPMPMAWPWVRRTPRWARRAPGPPTSASTVYGWERTR
jgi:acyl-CoA dehydrogenase